MLAEDLYRGKVDRDLGLPGSFMHLSTSKDTIESEATILVDWRKGIEVEVPISDTWVDIG